MIFSLMDTVFLTIISIFTLHSLYKGFVHVFINLFSTIISIFLATILYPYVKSYFSAQFKNDIFFSILIGGVSYLFFYIILNMVSSRLSSLCKPIRYNILDRFFGLIIGFIKGSGIVIILFATIIIFLNPAQKIVKINDLSNIKNKDYPYWLKNSMTVPYIEQYLKQIVKIIPSQIGQIKVNKREVIIDKKIQQNEIINNEEKNIIENKNDEEYTEDEKQKNNKIIIDFIKDILL